MSTDLREIYAERYEKALTPVANALSGQLQSLLSTFPRIDRITTRAKSVDRFVAKSEKKENGAPKYADPLNQIQDQIGARIVTFYKSDVEPISRLILSDYRPIESKEIIPQREWEFGYFGRHYILLTPTDLFSHAEDAALVAPVFELQIKTLFQHAWSEANHDLGYKLGEIALEKEQERLLAFTSAQAWGADRIFDDLFQAMTSK